MKKLFLLLFLGLTTLSCSSDSSSGSSLSDTPTAKPEFDNSKMGIYKGVFVGSSGTVLININNDSTVSATLVIDGATYTFTTTESIPTGNDTDIEDMTFTSGSMSFDFSVSAQGLYPTVSNITFSGHPNASINIIKEYSDALVKCYVGTFGGDDTGVFNIIISDGEVYGLAKSNDGEGFSVNGILNGSTIAGTFTGGVFSGTLSGNHISGSWENSLSESGTWSGHRKL